MNLASSSFLAPFPAVPSALTPYALDEHPTDSFPLPTLTALCRSLPSLIQALNSLRSAQGDAPKTRVHTITGGTRHSQAKWAAEVGKACEALKGLVQG